MDSRTIAGWEERNAFLARYAKTPIADFMLRYHSIAESTGRDDAVWQPFQIECLNDDTMFYSMNKSRQIGASFTVSGYAYADLMLKPYPDTVITTSINLEEAKEKIIYVKRWYESRIADPGNVPTRAEFRDGKWIGDQGNRIREYPEIVQASSFQITWSNGARFISHPSRPPRGKRASVINDEFHHVQYAGEIYRASIPMITRGRGQNWYKQLSTPAGAMGHFWEIHTGPDKYPDYLRRDYGWWEIFDLCAKEEVIAARMAYARGTAAEEMVKRFGTKMLRTLFNAVTIDDFEQEYNLKFLDSAYSFIPWELIRSCHPPYYVPNLDILEAGDDYIEDQDPAEVEKALERSYIGYTARSWEDSLMVIKRLVEHMHQGDIESDFIAGYDCGRRRDNAEISILGVTPGGIMKQRAVLTMPQTKFEHQRTVLKAMMEDLPVRRVVLDRGGMGEDISEWAEEKFGLRAVPVTYTNETKGQWASSLKQAMERRTLTIIPDRDQDNQLHSIQRKATQVGMIQYVVEERSTMLSSGQKVIHHADKFWALATAVSLAGEWFSGMGSVPRTSGTERIAAKLPQVVSKKGFSAVGSPRGRHSSVFARLGRRDAE